MIADLDLSALDPAATSEDSFIILKKYDFYCTKSDQWSLIEPGQTGEL